MRWSCIVNSMFCLVLSSCTSNTILHFVFLLSRFFFFFFNDTATTEIYTLSLHDALPICPLEEADAAQDLVAERGVALHLDPLDRKSTRLNSSHLVISYAVFCLKKKKNG